MESKLTKREYAVLLGMANGLTDKEAAGKLGISVTTVKKHRVHILEKLGANNGSHAVALAFKKGILRWRA